MEIRVEPHEVAILSYSGPDRSISDADLKEAKHLKARRYRNRRLGDFLKELSLSEGRLRHTQKSMIDAIIFPSFL